LNFPSGVDAALRCGEVRAAVAISVDLQTVEMLHIAFLT